MRPSTALVLEAGLTRLLTVGVGLTLLIGGLVGASQILERADAGHVDHAMIYLFVGLAVLGALMLPGIFAVVKPIFVLIFPGGVPLSGGCR